MKTKVDAVKGWMSKAKSDLIAMRRCIEGGDALDAACFHAQQAGEKALKAYLTAIDQPFPFVHNLEQLTDICEKQDPAFREMKELAQSLTPYAVELRYDEDFWPSLETALAAAEASRQIVDFITKRLPSECR